MTLQKWAEKWGVSKEALDDLMLTQRELRQPNIKIGKRNEAGLQNRVRLAETQLHGGILWRNNVGAARDNYGNFIRYGLANDSKALNNTLKSADLIGIRPVLIEPDMVGQTIGRFVSREIKAGRPQPNAQREIAQQNWALLINSLGGDAKIVYGNEP